MTKTAVVETGPVEAVRPGHACLLLAHEFSPSLLRSYERLREASEFVEVHLLFHVSGELPPQLASLPRVFAFRDEDIAELPFPPFRRAIVPGSSHFPLLLFRRSEPDFAFYWLVEYDVRFTGRWWDFFALNRDDPADLLTCHVGSHAAELRWRWWGSLRHGQEKVPMKERLRSFNPICRLSARAMDILAERHREGWTGHNEVLIPTLLHRAGCSVVDLGGGGPFTPPEYAGRFYSASVGTSQLRSTVRYRPPILWARRPDTLYHPVKNPSAAWRAAASFYLRRLRLAGRRMRKRNSSPRHSSR